MALVTKTLDGMYNGVTQRPAPLRASNRFQRQINYISDVVDGVSKRPNTEFVTTLSSSATEDAFIHTINRSLNEQFKVIFTADESEPIEVYDINGNKYSVSYDNQQTKDYVYSSDPKKFNKALTLKDETFILNTNTKVKSKTNFGDFDPTTLDKYCMAWIREGLPEIEYTLTVYDIDGNELASTTVESPASSNEMIATTDTNKVAKDIVNNIGPELPSEYEIFADGAVIFFKYTGSTSWGNANIKVDTSDGYGDTAFISINGKVDDHSELPPKGIQYYPIAVTGGRSIDEGAYYVEYNKQDNVYDETRSFFDFDGNILDNALDAETMPRIMTQQSDGSFLVKEADWALNEVGDEETSPLPSFVDDYINDIFFYRNRVGFLTKENIIFTKAGEYKDLFPVTAASVLDMDPIDVTVTTRKSVNLRHGIAFAKSLIVFSETVQFQVGTSGRALTPQSITVDPSTYFETTPYCEPVGAGPNIYFSVPKGDYSSIREYYVKTDTLVTDARDVTAHVPHYLPKGLDKLVSTSAYNMVFALSTEEQDTLYVYSHLKQGSSEQVNQVQSAWYKWKFEGEVILDIAINDNWLFMITKQGNSVYLLKLDLRMTTEENIPIKVFLDRKVELNGNYNADEDYTYLNLPYTDELDNFTAVDSTTGLATEKVEKVDNTTLKILGDYSDVPLLVGHTFESRLEYSPFYINNQNNMPDVQGKLQLKTVSLSFTKTGEFRFKITPYPRRNIEPYVDGNPELEAYLDANVLEQEFSGIILGEAVLNTPPVVTGEHTFSVTANAKKIRIELIADKHLPASFQLTAFEAEYSNRATHR